ncbi:DsbA family protein [Candidatus Saccharibacteria bacterium]|nr:DsbA family protein [Candidatus Saccharibacteria bacterium]
MSKLKWIIFIVITIGIFGILIATSKNNQLDVSGIDVNAIQVANNQNGNIADEVFGKVGSKVTLIEYGDYQCPGCGTINPTIKSITENYKDQLQFVFRNFPLTNIHQNAKAAAAAVESAGQQGKYWEMHARVYAGQSEWESLSGTGRTDQFTKYASEFGLDATKFVADMASANITNKISYDTALGKKANVVATPTFFLNGTKVDSDKWSTADFSTKLKEVIDAELTKASIALPK